MRETLIFVFALLLGGFLQYALSQHIKKEEKAAPPSQILIYLDESICKRKPTI